MRVPLIIVFITSLTILSVESPCAGTVKDLSIKVGVGTLGGSLGGGLGSPLYYIFSLGRRRTVETPDEEAVVRRSVAIAFHSGIMAGTVAGVYLAGDSKGSLLWTTAGASMPLLIFAAYVAFKGENPFGTFFWDFPFEYWDDTKHLARGCFLCAFFQSLGAAIGHELSLPEASRQKNEQDSQHAAYMTLLAWRF